MARLNLTAVLLAGGQGSRIRQLFPNIPKPLIPLDGVPVIEWIIRFWALQGVTDFVLSTGYLGDAIAQYFLDRPGLSNLRLRCVRETLPLGTGGAVAFVAQTVPVADTLLIGNADSLCAVDIGACLNEFVTSRAQVMIGTAFREDTAQFGSVAVNEANHITSFREKIPGPGLVNAGVYLMRRDLVARFATGQVVSMERVIFPTLLAEGVRFIAHPIEGEFLDIGTPAGYSAAEHFLHSLPASEQARNYGHV